MDVVWTLVVSTGKLVEPYIFVHTLDKYKAVQSLSTYTQRVARWNRYVYAPLLEEIPLHDRSIQVRCNILYYRTVLP